MRPRSATALRAFARLRSVLVGQGVVARSPAMTRCWLPGGRSWPARAPPPRFARRPWPPARLAASEIAKQEPPPAPLSGTSLVWVEREECARAGERVRHSRRARMAHHV